MTPTSPDLAARQALLAALTTDRALMALVHGVHDGTPVQAAPPYVVLGESLGSDWGGKSEEGREVTLGLSFYARGQDSIRIAAAVRAADLALAKLPRAQDGWQIVTTRVTRTKVAGSAELMKATAKGGGWAALMDVRMRLLAQG